VTATLPGMLADVMPGDASTNHAEVHFLAATQHGSPGTQGNRQNDVLQRVDLSPLGTPTRDIGPSMGFAARLPGPSPSVKRPIWYARLWSSSRTPSGTWTLGSAYASFVRKWAFQRRPRRLRALATVRPCAGMISSFSADRRA